MLAASTKASNQTKEDFRIPELFNPKTGRSVLEPEPVLGNYTGNGTNSTSLADTKAAKPEVLATAAKSKNSNQTKEDFRIPELFNPKTGRSVFEPEPVLGNYTGNGTNSTSLVDGKTTAAFKDNSSQKATTAQMSAQTKNESNATVSLPQTVKPAAKQVMKAIVPPEPTMTKVQLNAELEKQSKEWADQMASQMSTFDQKMNSIKSKFQKSISELESREKEHQKNQEEKERKEEATVAE